MNDDFYSSQNNEYDSLQFYLIAFDENDLDEKIPSSEDFC